jgi:hypothetical protein
VRTTPGGRERMALDSRGMDMAGEIRWLDVAMNERERATIVAALRYWQREGLNSFGPEVEIARRGGTLRALRAHEVDLLASRINGDCLGGDAKISEA